MHFINFEKARMQEFVDAVRTKPLKRSEGGWSQNAQQTQDDQHSTRQPAHRLRWMIRTDMAQVLRIENECFEYTWDDSDFLACLRRWNCIGVVVEDVTLERVTGFMIYELQKRSIHLINFAVAAEFRRKGVGAAMVAKLVSKLNQEQRRRNTIELEVRETNLAAQVFFRAMGFEATEVLRDHYRDSDEDAYAMRLWRSDQCTEGEPSDFSR